jgi:hypothetical protein
LWLSRTKKGLKIRAPSGFTRKALILVTAVIVGGIILGLISNSDKFNANQNLDMAGTGPAAAGASNVFGSFGGTSQVPSSTTPLQVGTTVTMMTTTVAGMQTNTLVVKPNSQSSQGSTTPQSNSSVSNGNIEFFSNVTLQVSSLQNSLNNAMAAAYTYGGYVAFSSYNNYTSTAVLRIPAANYQIALSQIESLGNLTGFQSNSNDVSVQYTDLNATLESLLTEQSSLLRLENKSTSLNSTLLIENELQGINAQINEVQSQILQTRILIDYSTITVTLERTTTATQAPLSLTLVATPKSGTGPLAVTFNAVVHGGSSPYVVNFNFGDGTSYQGTTLIHTYDRAGTFNATSTVTDSKGNVQEAWIIVHVSNPPTGSQLASFTNYVSGLLISVVEGIVEIAVIVLPIALVIGLVVLPFRDRLSSHRKDTKSV